MKFTGKTLFIIVGVVFLVWLTIPVTLMVIYGRHDSGVIGDTFGIVNALFSSLAFVLLIYTAWMQKEELELQRKELELTRNEIKKSAEAQETLVRLTEESLDIEKRSKAKQLFPRFKIHEFRAWGNELDKSRLRLSIKPQYHSVKLIDFQADTNTLTIDKTDFVNNKRGKIFEEDKIIAFEIVGPKDMSRIDGWKLELTYTDKEEYNQYCQKIVYQFSDRSFICMEPNQIPPTPYTPTFTR